MAAAGAALPDFTDAQIRALSSSLAEPGLGALFKAARREAQRVNRRPPKLEQVRAAVASVSTRQVYGRRPNAGTAAAASVREKWQCNLVSFKALKTTGGNRGHKFVLHRHRLAEAAGDAGEREGRTYHARNLSAPLPERDTQDC